MCNCSGTRRCDLDNDAYYRLWRVSIALIMAVSLVPLIYLELLRRSRAAIINHSPTHLSRGCRFLWLDYKDEFYMFEPVQQTRKLFLTGYVMLFPEHVPNARTLSASVLTLSFIVLMVRHSTPLTILLRFLLLCSLRRF